MDRQPWECPRCKRMNAPFVDQCPCDPDGGAPAIVPGLPSTQPPATVSVTTAHPWQIWSTYGAGSGGAQSTTTMTVVPSASTQQIHVHAKVDGREVFRNVRAEMLKWNQRNGGSGWLRAV